jgi:large repetitive protein
MNNIKKLAIFFTLIHLTACGVKVSESGKTVSDFILGSVSPLKGLISHHRPQHFQFMQNAYSAACPAGVSVNIHPLDSDGQIDFDTIIASAPLQSDTSFSIPRSKLPGLNHPTIRYMARVVGCNDRILMRPLTSALSPDGEDSVQDISYTTTLISASHNANASKKLSQVSKQQIEELINAVGSTSSEVEAFNTINSNITIASRFEQVFDSVPAVLQSAAPKVDLVAPASISENTSSEFRAVAHHWNPNYDIAYLWKINGTSISTNATWNFSPGANDQGTHTITLYVGKDDGAGDIDLNQPYTLNSFQLQIQNTVLPVAPILSLDTDQHPSSTISQTLVHLLLNTGAEQMNCQSFSALALSESAVMPSSSAAFTIECDTNFSQELTYTISPADGFKTLYLWAIDSAGVISLTPKTLTLTLDRSPPVLSFSNLASALRGGQNYLVEWNSSDVSGIAEHKLYYSINASDYTLISDGLTAQSHLWNVPAIDTTTLTFKLEAIDTIGNQSEILSSNKVIDSTPPTIAITSPAASAATQGSLTITGVCETGAQNVSVTGDISESVSTSCSGGNFTASIVLSGADGAKSVTIAQTDLVGNSSSLVRSFTKDTTPPSVQITSHANLDETNTVINLAGTCEADIDVNISGDTNSSTVSCTGGSFNHSLNLTGVDGTKNIQASQTDAASNTGMASISFIKDTTAPTITSLSINNGDTNTNNRNIVVSLSATSNRSDISSFCLKVNDNTQPASAHSCWKDLESIAMNITDELNLTNFPLQLGFTLGTYNVYAWTKDELGNISTLNEVAQVDTSSINFSPTPPAVISSVIASSVATPSSPLTSDDTTALAGSDLYVFWTIQDDNPIPANGISLYWTADETNYTELALNLSNNANGACSLTGGYTGCAVLPTASPSSSYFKIQIVVENQVELQSLSTSNPMNTGNFNLLSGNTSIGIGGSSSSAILRSRHEETNSNVESQQLVVTTRGDIYFIYPGHGLAWIPSDTGILEILIRQTGTYTGDNGPANSSTTRDLRRVKLDYDGNLLLWDYDRVRKVDLNSTNKTVSAVFGGGSDLSENATAENASIGLMEDRFKLFQAMPSGRVYYEKNKEIWYFDNLTNSVKKLFTLNGTGIGDLAGPLVNFDWDVCNTMNTAVRFSPSSSEFLKIIRRGYRDTTAQCANHSRAEPSWNANFDVSTGETQAPHPPMTSWWSNNFSGMDGEIYSIDTNSRNLSRYNHLTNQFDRIAGLSDAIGRCPDGTPATQCAMTIKSAFIDRFGKVYIFDLGVIRTIDSNGLVQTIAGQTRSFGVGENPLSARFSAIEFFDIEGDIVYVKNEKENLIVSFPLNGGNLTHIAGNGSQLAPSNGSLATTSPLQNGGWSMPVGFLVIDAEERLYHRRNSEFSFINLDTNQWEISSTIVQTNSRTSYLGKKNGAVLAYTTTHSPPIGSHNVFREIYPDGTSSVLYGLDETISNASISWNLCENQDPLTCTLPETLNESVQSRVQYDSGRDAWLLAFFAQKYVHILPRDGSIITKLSNTNQNISSFDYYDTGSAEFIYYCSTNGRLYARNITANTEAEISLPSSTIKCAGKSLTYHQGRNSIIFSFNQNNLWGIAEIDLN